MYEAKVIADSLNESNNVRLTTMAVRYWRAIHAEVMTHRVFSRNASSSRAIPVKTMLKQVWNDPAGPLHWGVNEPGMQARAQLYGWKRALAGSIWRAAAKTACAFAWSMMKLGLHKQIANRVLEPFQYISVIITSTEWENFFALRDHKDAQPEIQHLAREMKKAMSAAIPRCLSVGEWHLPYITPGDYQLARKHLRRSRLAQGEPSIDELGRFLCKISTARCARVSYMTHDGKFPSIFKDLELHDRLVLANPIHASPAEHQAVAVHNTNFLRNFRGWAQYRIYVEETLAPSAVR